jgi:hypothetical protein
MSDMDKEYFEGERESRVTNLMREFKITKRQIIKWKLAIKPET